MGKEPVEKPEPAIVDEPGMAERFQRSLQRALNTRAKKRPKPAKSNENVDSQKTAADRDG